MIYLDTSAAVKLLLEEPESRHVAATLLAAAEQRERLVSSDLLRLELTRVAVREQLEIGPVHDLVVMLDLVDITKDVVDAACRIREHVRSFDALHLATARALHSDDRPVQLLTFDTTMRQVGATMGLSVLAT